jgi:CRP-like cAMP-binding protein
MHMETTAFRSHPIFAELSDEEMRAIAGLVQEFEVGTGEVFIREGERSHDVFIIASGSVEILKRSSSDGSLYCLKVLEAGSCIGEMSVVEKDSERSASVRAKERTRLLRVRFDSVIERAEFRALHFKITTGIAKELSRKLRYANDVTVQALAREVESSRARIAFGVFSLTLMAILALYTIALRTLTLFVKEIGDSTPVTVGVAGIFAACVLLVIRRSGYPASAFGLTLKNARWVVLESLIFSLPILLALAAFKLVLITAVPGFIGRSFVDFPDMVTRLGKGRLDLYLLFFLFYTIFSPLQEFIARGGIQSSFRNFLPETQGRAWTSIVLSNLLFSMAHSHLNLSFALIAFVPGLFWGWMYERHRSLLGVCISHVLIGDFAIYILGFSSSFFARGST